MVVAVVAAGSGGAAAVLGGGGIEEPQPVVRAEKFYDPGPSATYSDDSGGIGAVRPLRLVTPADAPAYDAVVEVSSTARTRGPGPFTLDVTVDTGAGDGQDDPTVDDLRTRPTGPVGIEPDTGAPATARWLVRALEPGTTYRVVPSVGSTSPDRGTNAVRLRGTLVTVELAPATP